MLFHKFQVSGINDPQRDSALYTQRTALADVAYLSDRIQFICCTEQMRLPSCNFAWLLMLKFLVIAAIIRPVCHTDVRLFGISIGQ